MLGYRKCMKSLSQAVIMPLSLKMNILTIMVFADNFPLVLLEEFGVGCGSGGVGGMEGI